MGMMGGHRFRLHVLAVALLSALASPARAEVTTEKSASILIFPKLLYDNFFDTIIQISSTSNSPVWAHCFYVDARLTDPSLPPGPLNPAVWQEVDFDLVLTRQQPTHWVISEGRSTDPFDPTCNNSNQDCNDAGFDPGRIPPVSPGFQGWLECIQVMQDGAPTSGNQIKGEATIQTRVPQLSNGPFVAGDSSKYNAIGLIGEDSNDADTVLCIGGKASAKCPAGAEYKGCPNQTVLSHYADGTSSPLLNEFNAFSAVQTQMTVVPCAQDFETQTPSRVRIQFVIYNEFEEPFSTSTTVTCWGNFSLAEVNPILTVSSLGSRFVQTYLRPATGDPGFVMVQEEFHRLTDGSPVSLPKPASRVAFNVHVVGERPQTDLVIIPEGP